jgi:hypothetical protein
MTMTRERVAHIARDTTMTRCWLARVQKVRLFIATELKANMCQDCIPYSASVSEHKLTQALTPKQRFQDCHFRYGRVHLRRVVTTTTAMLRYVTSIVCLVGCVSAHDRPAQRKFSLMRWQKSGARIVLEAILYPTCETIHRVFARLVGSLHFHCNFCIVAYSHVAFCFKAVGSSELDH